MNLSRRSTVTFFKSTKDFHITLCTEGFDGWITQAAAPIATGWSESCRVGLLPTEVLRLCTAHWKNS
jgi:hypothetical protein